MKNWKVKIIFVALILTLFILSLINFSKNLSSYIEIKNKFSYNTHYLNNLSFFKKRLAQLEKEIQGAPKKIINDLDHISLLNKCSKYASEFDIDIISYNPINKLLKKKKEFKEVSIELNFKTDYLNLNKFINKIENMDYITKIDNLEIYRIEPYSSRIKSKIIITGFTINEKQ